MQFKNVVGMDMFSSWKNKNHSLLCLRSIYDYSGCGGFYISRVLCLARDIVWYFASKSCGFNDKGRNMFISADQRQRKDATIKIPFLIFYFVITSSENIGSLKYV